MTSAIAINFKLLVMPLGAAGASSALRALAWISLVVSALCAAGIAVDIALGRRQHMKIMNVVWPVTASYGGIFALWAYAAFGRAMKHSGSHAQHAHMSHVKRPMWQSAVTGTTHCGAGCAVGDVLSEGGLYLLGAASLLGSTLLTSYVLDFAAAYLLGIIFQYFAIVPMRKLSPGPGLWAAVKADTLSLIAFQIGMYAWMAVSQRLLFQPSLEPNSPVYWFMMQIAMVFGFITSFPMNWFLIQSGVKERM